MSVRILEDLNEDKAVMYDSVTGFAFGPVFDGPLSRDRAERFLEWLRENTFRTNNPSGDARTLTEPDLIAAVRMFDVEEDAGVKS